MNIRRAVPGDEPLLRAIRIQALTDAPSAFGSTLERELSRTAAEWTSWLSPSATFLLEADGEPKGIAAGVPDATEQGLVWLMAMWLHPGLRGSGGASRLVEAVLDWASQVDAERIRLDVVEGNDPAIRLYERHGFRLTGRTFERSRDGAIEFQMERTVYLKGGRPHSTMSRS